MRLGSSLMRGKLPLSQVRTALGRDTSGDVSTGVSPGLMRQVVRFGMIGIASTVAYLVLFMMLSSVVGAQLANFAALLITAVGNTAANRRLTFGVTGRSRRTRQHGQGLLVFGFALAITSGSLAVLHATGNQSLAVEVVVLVVANLGATLFDSLLSSTGYSAVARHFRSSARRPRWLLPKGLHCPGDRSLAKVGATGLHLRKLGGHMATYSLPDLPYDYSALAPAISGEILELHHDKHHAAYVKGANDTLDQLAEARDKGAFGGIVGLEKSFAFNLSGHVLHSIFWENLSPDGGDRPDGELAAAIEDNFGSFDAFKAQLTSATTLVQGSGWACSRGIHWAKADHHPQVYDHHGNVGMNTTRCSYLMPGSTRTTCNTRTCVLTTSRSCGTSSTGPMSRLASTELADSQAFASYRRRMARHRDTGAGHSSAFIRTAAVLRAGRRGTGGIDGYRWRRVRLS